LEAKRALARITANPIQDTDADAEGVTVDALVRAALRELASKR
jgi:hypothetical protein